MDHTQASEAWKGLDLAGLEDCSRELEEPERHWQKIALALAHKDDALGCMESCDALSTCDPSLKLAGTSAADWLTLGQRFVDVALARLGAKTGERGEFDHPNYFGHHAIHTATSLSESEIDYSAYALALFDKLDPIDWLEGPPLLLRLGSAPFAPRSKTACVRDRASLMDEYPYPEFEARLRELLATSAPEKVPG